MTWGLFVLLCMVVGWFGMIVTAICEYAFNDVRVKVFFNRAKWVFCALGLLGFIIIALVCFG